MPESRAPSYYKGNQVKQLRAFCAAAHHGTMTLAAEQLFTSQSAISLQIAALEQELGVKLFVRRRPQLELTEAGEHFHALARPVMDALGSLKQRFDNERTERLDSGQINIAAGESTILYFLPVIVEAFRAAYPGVHVHLHNVTGRDGLAMIRADEVDLAVGSMLDIPADIYYEPLYAYRPALIMPEGHPLGLRATIGLKDLSPHGLILPPRRLTTWRVVDRIFQKHRIPFEVSLEVGGWEVIKQYVARGFGISIVTSLCLEPEDALETRDLSEYFPKRSYGLVMKKGKALKPQAEAFVTVMKAVDLPETEWRKRLKRND